METYLDLMTSENTRSMNDAMLEVLQVCLLSWYRCQRESKLRASDALREQTGTAFEVRHKRSPGARLPTWSCLSVMSSRMKL